MDQQSVESRDMFHQPHLGCKRGILEDCFKGVVCPLLEQGSKKKTEAEVIFRYKGKTLMEAMGDYDCPEQGVEQISEVGWEDDTPALRRSLFIVRDRESEKIVAVGMYQDGRSTQGKERPDLLWIYADGRQIRKRCYY